MIPISPTNSKIFELKFDFLTIYCVGKTVGGKSLKFREYSQTISVNIYILWVLLTAEKSSDQKTDQKLKFTGFQIAWRVNIHPSLWTLKWPAKFNLTISVYAARLLTDNLDNLDSAESDFIFAELHSLVYDSNNYQNQIFRCQVEILFR